MMRKVLIVWMVVCLFAALTGGAAAQSVPAPAITITSPMFGAVVTNEGTITVTGIATNLFEGGLAVQALDAAGTVLASQAVTAAGAALGGTGTWTANLTVSVAANTPGRIYAYSTSAQDGSLEAQASVNVTYGAAAPVPTATTPPSGAAITITSPVPGAVVTTAGGVVVSGTSRNIFEAQFMLEARDANGTVLAQTGVMATGVESGTWQAVLNPVIAATTPGTLVAYDTGGTGEIIVSTAINVTFVPSCAPRTDWPTYQVQVGDNLFRIAERVGSTMNELALANCLANPSVIVVGQTLYVPQETGGAPVGAASLTITAPVQGASIPPGTPLTVTGTGALLFEGNVVVRVLDERGNLLAVQPTTLVNVQPDGTGSWQIAIPVTMVQGARGMVVAYSPSGLDGSIVVSDAVNVVFGAAPPAETVVTIDSPLPYASVNGAVITVSGRAARLVDGLLVVEARDHSGRLLAQRLVQAAGDQWTTQITATVAPGTHGMILAYPRARFEAGGGFASIPVVFDATGSAQPFVTIMVPLPGDQMIGNVGVRASGVPQGAFVLVEVLDAAGVVIAWVPAQMVADTLWNADLTFDPALLSGGGSVAAYFTDPATGSVLAYDRIPVQFGQ